MHYMFSNDLNILWILNPDEDEKFGYELYMKGL